MKVAVIYWTNTGNTEQMAEEIALGARDAGADITLTTYADTTPEEALQADRLPRHGHRRIGRRGSGTVHAGTVSETRR